MEYGRFIIRLQDMDAAPDPVPPAPESRASDSPRAARPRLFIVAAVTASLGIVLSVFLLVDAWRGDTSILPGCGGPGAGGGCGSLGVTRWATVFGVPVAWLALGTYGLILATLLVRRRLGGVVLAAAAAVLLGGGLWFTWLQLAVLQDICRWCMAAHLTGAVLAGALLIAAQKRDNLLGTLIGSALVLILIAVQGTAPTPPPTEDVVVSTASAEAATLSLLDGRLNLNLADEIWTGSPGNADAQSPAYVKMFDYACHRCRELHRATDDADTGPSILLPVPLGHGCNGYMAAGGRRDFYAESCGLARLAWAVHRADPARFAAFHDWMFAEGWPRSVAEARSYAISQVDLGELNQALVDPAGEAFLQRNVEAWGQARAAGLVGGLPAVLTPDGRVYRQPLADRTWMESR